MKIAIVYDRVNKWGGAERVLLTLKEIFPEAHLFTSVYNLKGAPWAKSFKTVNSSFLQKIPGMSTRHDLMAPLMPLAFESFKFDKYDLVISVTSEAAKGIITNGKTKHICYCLTPTRYLWSGYNEYFNGKLKRILSKPVVSYLRSWDTIAAQRPDQMIAISSAVKKRINKYYRRDSDIIHPPLNNKFISLIDKSNKKRQDYFLLVSRLIPYKKVDMAIQAFNQIGKPLIIVGTGSSEKKLKRMANKNIIFVGRVNDLELGKYYSEARALIFPQHEDFGLVAVEAQAFGTPVIAFKKGGALDIIQNYKNGLFFEKQNVDSIIGAVKLFDKVKFNSNIVRESVNRFSESNFKNQIINIVKNI